MTYFLNVLKGSNKLIYLKILKTEFKSALTAPRSSRRALISLIFSGDWAHPPSYKMYSCRYLIGCPSQAPLSRWLFPLSFTTGSTLSICLLPRTVSAGGTSAGVVPRWRQRRCLPTFQGMGGDFPQFLPLGGEQDFWLDRAARWSSDWSPLWREVES